MQILKKYRLIILVLMMSINANASVWDATNQWNAEWENKYEQWVKANWNIHVFDTKLRADGSLNPYYGLRTDCADTVYSMRIIYSFENKLPFVVNDPTKKGNLINNNMSRWDGLSSNDKIKNFLKAMFSILSTRSLPNDTIPVAISREWIHSGGLILATKVNHHSWTIKDILSFGIPHLIYHSVAGGATTSTLDERKSWPNPSWVFQGDQTPQGNAGFRYWKPQSYITDPAWKVPGYSEEQYRIPLNSWVEVVQHKLALDKETDQSLVNRMLGNICDGINSRIKDVKEAIDFVNASGNKCMDYTTYDNYSTPSRDHRVYDDMMSLRKSYKQILDLNGGRLIDPKLKKQLDKIYPQISQSAMTEAGSMQVSVVDQNSVCIISYQTNKKADLAEIKRRMFLGLISNNPLDGLLYRWGELKGPSTLAKQCPSWDVWVPDLKE